MENLGHLHKASDTPRFTTVSRAKREDSTGHYNTLLIFKCCVMANTSQVLVSTIRGRKIPKILLAVASRDLFHKRTHGWPDTMNSIPRPWNCTHASITRLKEHLLWLSASSHHLPAAKPWNESHIWDRRL